MHPEKVAANMRKVRARQGDAARDYQRRYAKANPERRRLYDAKKVAKRKAAIGATVARVTLKQWKDIQRRHGYRCAYCGKKPRKLTMDHIVALSRGGDHTARNIVPACGLCNNKKNAGDPIKFAQQIGRLL